MANVSKLIFGAAIAAASIASPALAQSDPSIHHRNRITSYQSDPRTLAAPPTEYLRDRRTWVGDPAGRPYVYIPGQASGGQ